MLISELKSSRGGIYGEVWPEPKELPRLGCFCAPWKALLATRCVVGRGVMAHLCCEGYCGCFRCRQGSGYLVSGSKLVLDPALEMTMVSLCS